MESPAVKHSYFLKKFMLRFAAIYVLLFITSLSFSYYYLFPNVGKYTAPFYAVAARWFGMHVLGTQPGAEYRIMSDSTGMYVLMLLLLVFAYSLVT